MGEVLPLPSVGDLFADIRGDDRTMRVSWHPERGAVVLSLWAGAVCRGSFRMSTEDVPRLLSLLAGIAEAVPPAAQPGDPVAPASDAPATGVAVGTPSEVEQTGDLPGAAHRSLRPIVPVPRVA